MQLPYCALYRFPPGHRVKMHKHNDWEIVYFVEGSGTSEVDGVCYNISKHSITVVPAGVVHNQVGETELASICIRHPGEHIDNLQGYWMDVQGVLELPSWQLLLEVGRKEPFYERICIGLLEQIIGLLQRLAFSNKGITSHYTRRAMDIILRREGGISTNDVAEELHITPDHLRHVFRQQANITPRRFILQVRMSKAKSLLVTTDLPVATVATLCGFSSLYHFSRLFKQSVGLPPSNFRNNNRNS